LCEASLLKERGRAFNPNLNVAPPASTLSGTKSTISDSGTSAEGDMPIDNQRFPICTMVETVGCVPMNGLNQRVGIRFPQDRNYPGAQCHGANGVDKKLHGYSPLGSLCECLSESSTDLAAPK
jgi:hypothetical protein